MLREIPKILGFTTFKDFFMNIDEIKSVFPKQDKNKLRISTIVYDKYWRKIVFLAMKNIVIA